MQTFSALLGSNATGASSSRTSPSGGAPDDHRDPGGFDRLMQSQSRSDTRTASPRQEATRPRESERTREPEGARKADEGGKREAKRAESRADEAPRRTEAKDADSIARDTDGSDDSAGSEGSDTAAAPAAPADAAATADASVPVSLPEQLLAMLNGLSAAPADAATALPTDALASGSIGTTTGTPRPLPAFQPAAVSGDAPPAANDTDANAFALAMGVAATAGDAAPEATLDTTTTGEIATTPLSVSNATVHPLTRAAAAAVQANQPLSVDAGFEDGFGSRIAWLADQKVGHAEIRVSPDHLGTIDVRLQLDGNRVNAEFHSAQVEVRNALESSLPRLREMLGQQGLQLGHADVGQRQPGGQPSGSSTPSPSGERGEADAGWTPGPAVRSTRGLLDEYA